jgi:hypothetical protein
MFYQIYELTYGEVKMTDAKFDMSKSEYKALKI